jgi:mannosyltransferase
VLVPLGATLLAAACVLNGIGDKSLWFDEGLSLHFATVPFDEFWRLVTSREANGGLYYVFLRQWLRFGAGEAWARGLAGVAMVATVPVLYAVGRRLVGLLPAAAGVVLFATHPLVVQFGQEARTYGVVVLAVTVATLALLRALDSGRATAWAAWAAALVTAVYLHFFAALVGVVHGIAILLRGPARGRWRLALPAAVAAGVAALPLAWFVMRTDGAQLDWVTPPDARDVRYVLAGFSGYGGDLGLTVAAAAWLLGSAGVAWGKRRWGTAVVVLWAVLPPPRR